MTYGQAVRKAITDSVNKTGTDTAWRFVINPMFRPIILNMRKMAER